MSDSRQYHLVRLFSEWLQGDSDRTTLHFYRKNREVFCRMEINGWPEDVLGLWDDHHAHETAAPAERSPDRE